MLSILAVALCIGAGTIGGVFFAFSTFVIKALAQLPAVQGVAAMQGINRTVLNLMFLGAFMGTAVVSILCIVAGLVLWRSPGSLWLMAAGSLYLAGTWGVTLACNVPRNDRLGRIDPSSADAIAYWPRYVEEWSAWNHVRTIAALASCACAAIALAP